MNLDELISIIERLKNYIISEKYAGYDPYDVLSSPIFKLPILRNNRLIRFSSQQIFRRIPFNLRPLLGIKKEINPVTLGLCIQAYSYLSDIFKEKREFYKKEIGNCIDKLIELSSKGYSGYCWGYNFDWEARYAKISAYTPTIVATGIITNSLYEYYKFSKDKKVIEIIIDSTKFVLNDLKRTYNNGSFCFSYSPNDNQIVFNATMKAARLLAQAYNLNGDIILKNEAQKTIEFVLKYQKEDGSWTYSEGDKRNWVDNFHTAYVLDSLIVCNDIFENIYELQLKKGLKYYISTFFNEQGEAKYYSNNKYPIDSTAVAQSIITLLNTGYIELANKVVHYGIKNLWSKKNHFFYRKHKFFTDKTSYQRWSNAWMLVALSFLLLKNTSLNNDLD